MNAIIKLHMLHCTVVQSCCSMTHYDISVVITENQDLFFTILGKLQNMLIIVLRKCIHFSTGIWECIMCYVIYLLVFQLDKACIYSSLNPSLG